MSITTTLFPPANREAATVAFLRTFWQTARAAGSLVIAGGAVITANQLEHIDWAQLLYGVGAVIVTSLLAGGLAGGNILVHGLPAAYTTPPVLTPVGATSAPAPAVAPVVPPAA
jgi:hypothetical protein